MMSAAAELCPAVTWHYLLFISVILSQSHLIFLTLKLWLSHAINISRCLQVWHYYDLSEYTRVLSNTIKWEVISGVLQCAANYIKKNKSDKFHTDRAVQIKHYKEAVSLLVVNLSHTILAQLTREWHPAALTVACSAEWFCNEKALTLCQSGRWNTLGGRGRLNPCALCHHTPQKRKMICPGTSTCVCLLLYSF